MSAPMDAYVFTRVIHDVYLSVCVSLHLSHEVEPEDSMSEIVWWCVSWENQESCGATLVNVTDTGKHSPREWAVVAYFAP